MVSQEFSPVEASALEAASFYRRPLPQGQVAFSSAEGRELFREALAAGHMEGWFALAEQFHTQAEPAFCGLGSLVVVLNALEIDPGRVWKGPWRWYGESLLDCCKPLEAVQAHGITLDELACLASCNGARAVTARPDQASVHDLRAQIQLATTKARGPVIVASYSRSALGQTGGGHFSPIAGYHPARDLALILDVARFKYPPHWVPVPLLWEAMTGIDDATGLPRGWVLLQKSAHPTRPMYFRLMAPRGLNELVTTLLDDAPALLAAAPSTSPEALVKGWVHAVGSRIADSVQGSLGQLVTPEDLPNEHRAALTQLLAELRATPAYQAIAAARTADGNPRLADEVLAVLLLALPEPALALLPAENRAQLAKLRRESDAGTLLSQEVQALREQLTSVRRWQCQAVS
jgi:glutathione gamma-glutamylcysteinyltransferase